MDIKISQTANLPSRFGNFKVQAYKQGAKEHLAIFKEPLGEIPNIRIHSECLTGDVLGSLKCDCRDQLESALEFIQKNGGMVIYLRQEGRNIGLLNKINAYALQDDGMDTVEANHKLGFKSDERTYEAAEFILKSFGFTDIKLLTNNPQKLTSLKGINVVERIPIIVKANPKNSSYLKVKKEKMGHLL
ncbi:MAG: GTP cyclohydrolase II [Campylobacteraceae bacterium]|jgi:GTP cyclohydrolase II|nr:GTP cyclohydrolase II [Campylobacteraceae bacterium]